MRPRFEAVTWSKSCLWAESIIMGHDSIFLLIELELNWVVGYPGDVWKLATVRKKSTHLVSGLLKVVRGEFHLCIHYTFLAITEPLVWACTVALNMHSAIRGRAAFYDSICSHHSRPKTRWKSHHTQTKGETEENRSSFLSPISHRNVI